MNSINLIELHKVLLSGELFIVAGHMNPDGDAVAAAFAMAEAIAMIGGKPIVLLDDFAARYKELPGNEYLYKGNPDELQGDVFIAVDCSTKERLGEAANRVFDRTEVTVNLDHHATNELYAKHNFVKAEASSTCELVYQLINHMVPLDADIATNLYTGIVFDTGGFCYGSTTHETFQIASRLIHMGIDFTHINRSILHSHSLAEAKAFGRALATLRVESGGRIAAALLTLKDMNEVGADASDLDGIVEYMLATGSAEAAVLVSERPDGTSKASMRSTELDLLPIVTRHGGGGHKNAAGFSVKMDAEKLLATVASELAADLTALNAR